jgi:hypothetical protein
MNAVVTRNISLMEHFYATGLISANDQVQDNQSCARVGGSVCFYLYGTRPWMVNKVTPDNAPGEPFEFLVQHGADIFIDKDISRPAYGVPFMYGLAQDLGKIQFEAKLDGGPIGQYYQPWVDAIKLVKQVNPKVDLSTQIKIYHNIDYNPPKYIYGNILARYWRAMFAFYS